MRVEVAKVRGMDFRSTVEGQWGGPDLELRVGAAIGGAGGGPVVRTGRAWSERDRLAKALGAMDACQLCRQIYRAGA
jgi:hypothetical protein